MRNVFVNNSILLNGFSVYCYLSQFQIFYSLTAVCLAFNEKLGGANNL